MRLRRLAFGLGALCTSFAGSTAQAAEKWLKAETRHFVIYSAGKPAQLEDFSRRIEKFDTVLRLLTNTKPDDQPPRLPIYVLATAESVSDLADDKNRSIAGFYRPSKYGSFAVANRERGNDKFDLKGDTVLQHEYAHHFMFRNFAFAYPAWYIEGFAEFVATADFAPDESWTAGKPPYYRAYGLVLGRDLPIEKLLFGGTAGMPRDLADVYYGRAWLLVHMLRNDKARAGQLDTYLRALGNGTPEREAAKTFGDLAVLDKQLDAYLKEKRIAIVKGKGPLNYAKDIRISELDPIDSQLVVLSMRRQAEKDLPRTRDQLRTLANQAPSRAPVWLELALVEKELADAQEDIAAKRAGWTTAEAAIDKALTADPKHGRPNLLKAKLLMDRLDSDNQRSAVAWKPVRAHITRANRADPLDPVPLFTWYEATVRQGLEPDKLASDGLALAFSLAPEAIDLRVNYAWDLARQKQFDAAIRTIEFVVRDPHNAERGTELLARLRQMRDQAGQSGKPGESDRSN
jgi:hypothetical protein